MKTSSRRRSTRRSRDARSLREINKWNISAFYPVISTFDLSTIILTPLIVLSTLILSSLVLSILVHYTLLLSPPVLADLDRILWDIFSAAIRSSCQDRPSHQHSEMTYRPGWPARPPIPPPSVTFHNTNVNHPQKLRNKYSTPPPLPSRLD